MAFRKMVKCNLGRPHMVVSRTPKPKEWRCTGGCGPTERAKETKR